MAANGECSNCGVKDIIATECTECGNSFCQRGDQCAGYFLLTSIGEKQRRFLCLNCVQALREGKKSGAASESGKKKKGGREKHGKSRSTKSSLKEHKANSKESKAAAKDAKEQASSVGGAAADVASTGSATNSPGKKDSMRRRRRKKSTMDRRSVGQRERKSITSAVPSSSPAAGDAARHHSTPAGGSSGSEGSVGPGTAQAPDMTGPPVVKLPAATTEPANIAELEGEVKLRMAQEQLMRAKAQAEQMQLQQAQLQAQQNLEAQRKKSTSLRLHKKKDDGGDTKKVSPRRKASEAKEKRNRKLSKSARGRLKASGGGKKKGSARSFDVMHATLDQIMEHQQGVPALSVLKVPYVIKWLVEKILECGGTTTEGIFRLSIASSDIADYSDLLSDGKYDFGTSDPNVYAVMLKHFLRHLPDPLIPSYEACLAMEQANMSTPKGVQQMKELWEKHVPHHSKEVIKHLTRFLKEMTKPEHVKETKMSMENYAIVFTPGFLRNPSTDVQAILMGQAKEQKCVELVLRYVEQEVLPKEDAVEREARERLAVSGEDVEVIVRYEDEDGNSVDPPPSDESVEVVEEVQEIVVEYISDSEE